VKVGIRTETNEQIARLTAERDAALIKLADEIEARDHWLRLWERAVNTAVGYHHDVRILTHNLQVLRSRLAISNARSRLSGR